METPRPGPELASAINNRVSLPVYRVWGVCAPRLEQVPAEIGGARVLVVPAALNHYRHASDETIKRLRRRGRPLLYPRLARYLLDRAEHGCPPPPLRHPEQNDLERLALAVLCDIYGLRQAAAYEWLRVADAYAELLRRQSEPLRRLRAGEPAGLHVDERELRRKVSEGRAALDQRLRRLRELLAGKPARLRVDERELRRKVSEGRRLWAALAAWPWWAIADADAAEHGGGDQPETWFGGRFGDREWWREPRVVETWRAWLQLDSRRAAA